MSFKAVIFDLDGVIVSTDDYHYRAWKKISDEEEKLSFAERKNSLYRNLLEELTSNDILPGVMNVLETLKSNDIKIAIGSSSKNTKVILNKIGLNDYFDAISDGTQIKNSKPNPEVFLLAAEKLCIDPKDCLVVEDADAGVEAGLDGGMKVLAVGYAASNGKANLRMKSLEEFKYEYILKF